MIAPLRESEYRALCRLVEQAGLPEELGVSTMEAVRIVLALQEKLGMDAAPVVEGGDNVIPFEPATDEKSQQMLFSYV